MRTSIVACVIVVMLCSAGGSADAGENIWCSALVPGWGQIKSGHYGRGSVFLSAELMSLSALGIVHLQYERAVEQYDRAKGEYLAAQYIGDALSSYDLMRRKWDDAEELHRYRTAAVAAAIGVWTVNMIDAILFDGSGEAPLAMEVGRDGFRIVGAVSF